MRANFKGFKGFGLQPRLFGFNAKYYITNQQMIKKIMAKKINLRRRKNVKCIFFTLNIERKKYPI